MSELEILEAFEEWLERFGDLPMDDYIHVLDVLQKDLRVRIVHAESEEN